MKDKTGSLENAVRLSQEIANLLELNGGPGMWEQFVAEKSEWIGGDLEDFGDSTDQIFMDESSKTKITDIVLKPNGPSSAWFGVEGEDFGCGFDVKVGGLSGDQPDKDWIEFRGYSNHRWRIRKPNAK